MWLGGAGAGAAAREVVEADLKVVGRLELGTPATYGDLTVAGTTAVVATQAVGSPCAGASAAVLDLKAPRSPKVVASIALPAGTAVADLDSATLLTPVFTGDVLAVALRPCGGAGTAGASVALYDITDPAAPRRLAQTGGGASVSLAQRGDGRAIAVRAGDAGVVIDDLTDPASPAPLGRWAPPAAGGDACGPPTAQVDEGGEAAVVLSRGLVYHLDLSEPTVPFAAGPAEGPGEAVAVLPLGNRTIAVVAQGDGCSGESGLRVLGLTPGAAPKEEAPVRYPGAGAPGRLVASGTLAYVAWHGAGLRVVDLAEVRATTVAQFVPEQADVVSVGLLAEHVVVADANQGVFVLERPDEGGGRATFWSQFLSLLPYLGGAVFMAAAFVLPRALASRAGATAPVPVPGAEPVRRRRA